MIRADAERIAALHARVHETLPLRTRSKQDHQIWQKACADFHQYQAGIDRYFTPEALKQLQAGAEPMVEFALAFLEVNPWFFRSGYLKAILLHRLKSVTFTPFQIERLQRIFIQVIKDKWTKEFKYYCRLAVRLDHPPLWQQLLELSRVDDKGVATRAQVMLNYIRKHGKIA